MSRRSPGFAAVALLAAALVAVAGCSLLAKKKKPELAYEEHPVDVLYNAGADRLDRHQWNEAVDYFREVERQHPYSEWSRRSILMTAYAHYMANDYTDALQDADQFISLYPGNSSAQYAYYLKAICYFEQIVDVGRDQASTAEAGEALREVAKRYPNSDDLLYELEYYIYGAGYGPTNETLGKFIRELFGQEPPKALPADPQFKTIVLEETARLKDQHL